jgi:tetratricopeptide (TPR) repeat protein
MVLLINVFGQDRDHAIDKRRMAVHYERTGDYDRAAQYYIEISLSNPKDISGYLGAKRCLIQLDALERFRDLILLLQTRRRDLRYQVDLIDIEYRNGQTSQAVEKWIKLLNEHQQNQTAYQLIGSILTEHRRFEEALSVYEEGREHLDNPHVFLFERIGILTAQRQYETIIHEYIDYLAHHPGQQAFIDSRILSLCQNDDISNTIATVLEDEYEDRRSMRSRIGRIRTRVYIRMGSYRRAIDMVETLSASDETYRAQADERYLQIANSAARNNMLEEARHAYNNLLTLNPDSDLALQARYGLAKTYEQEGNVKAAIRAYLTLANEHPQSVQAVKGLYRCGTLNLQKVFDLDRASTCFQRLLDQYPNSSYRTDALFRLSEVAIARGNLERAQETLQQLNREGDKNRSQVRLMQAYVSLYQGEIEDCRQTLNDILEPESIDLKDETVNDALELKMLIDSAADSATLDLYGKARFYRDQHRYEEGLGLLNTALDTQKGHITEALLWLRSELYVEKKQFGPALEDLIVLEQNEDGLYREQAMKRRAELYATVLEDAGKAVDIYLDYLNEFPQSIHIESVRKRIRELESNT